MSDSQKVETSTVLWSEVVQAADPDYDEDVVVYEFAEGTVLIYEPA